jgi:hypothetical protein
MAGLEESIVEMRKRYPSIFDIGDDNAAGDIGASADQYLSSGLPSASADAFTLPTPEVPPAPTGAAGGGGGFEYKYPGYAGQGGGNFGGYEGVSGEGQPQPSPQQVEDRANWRLSQSARVRAGLQEMGGGGNPQMGALEQAIAQLRLPTGMQGPMGFSPGAGFSG